MRKKLAVVLSLGLLASAISATAATPPKPGANCTKAGLTQNYNGMKYTCTKSGKKMIWDSGKPITPEPNIEIDPRISPNQALSDISRCQTTDLTQGPGMNNGFPRPSWTVAGKVVANVLVVPVALVDRPYSQKDIATITKVYSDTADFYKEQSYGFFTMKYKVLPPERGIYLSQTAKEAGADGRIDEPFLTEYLTKILGSWEPSVNLDEYDVVVLSSNAGGNAEVKVQPYQTRKGTINSLVLEFGGFPDLFLNAHELGHALFGFEDLYLQTPQLNQNWLPAGVWDIMSDDISGRNFMGWNRFLAGWLPSSQIRCLTDQTSTVHYLSNIDRYGGYKLLILNLSPGVSIAVDSRTSVSELQMACIEKIDTNIGHGQGPVRLLGLIREKSSLDVEGWNFTLLASDKKGLLLQVKRN